jgi:hypothetical protein
MSIRAYRSICVIGVGVEVVVVSYVNTAFQCSSATNISLTFMKIR